VSRPIAGAAALLLLVTAAYPATRPIVDAVELAGAAAANPLHRLGWLVGGTWTAEEKAADGSPLVVKLRCRWGDTGQAILFRVGFIANGAETPQYDGMFVWHPGRSGLTLWQVDRKGQVAEGEVTGAGDELDQVVRVSHPDGSMHFLKAHYRRQGRDAFHFKAFFRPSETAAWRDAVDVVYVRRPAGPAAR
jgi:hypothetical protein